MNSLPLVNLPIVQSGNSVSNQNQSSISQDEAFSSILEQIVSEATQNETNVAQSSQTNVQAPTSKSQLQSGNESSDQSVSGQMQPSVVPISVSNQMPIINLPVQILALQGSNSSQDQISTQSSLKEQTNASINTLTQPNTQILGPLQDVQLVSIQPPNILLTNQSKDLGNLINNDNMPASVPVSESTVINQLLSNVLNSPPVSNSQINSVATNSQSNSNVSSTLQTSNQTPFLLDTQLNIFQAQSAPQSTPVQAANSTLSNQLAQNNIVPNFSYIQTLQTPGSMSQDNSGANAATLNTLSNLSQNLETISNKSSSILQLMPNLQVVINQSNLPNSVTGPLLSSQNLNQEAFIYQNQVAAQNISNNITSQILSNLSIPSSVNSQISAANILSRQIISNFNQTNSLSNSPDSKLTSTNEAILSGLPNVSISNSSNMVMPNQGISYHSISLDAYQKIQNMMQDLRFNSPKDIEFLLEPPDLGKVKLNVSLDKATNSVNMTFFVVDDLAKHAILSNMQDFRQILQSNGFATNNVNVYVNSDQKGQGFSQDFSHVIYPLDNNNNVSLDTALITGIQSLKSGVDIRV
ncbi:hypothetical protein Thena_1816 [Thermodesulfobium narugense DSM 14796]|uniref:Flagellar hook-length control protein-like C-terminal domain-containing protein n=1 Tax=Thermodesulfobium narugense DSM 14796 TaxID=747365 RepID=M1E646_9BACT|nr:flagellar hook-length control protein FliK [Thermodesulfobium narugense]AEE15422.1 hypothetical protein Thena_1816 [Thermodesulfobium narugense DSM 14796]